MIMALKVILRQMLVDGKILALFPEIPGKNLDECLVCNEDGQRFHTAIKNLIKISKKIDKAHAIWLIENLEQEFGKLKLVKKEHADDYNKRFQRLTYRK